VYLRETKTQLTSRKQDMRGCHEATEWKHCLLNLVLTGSVAKKINVNDRKSFYIDVFFSV
jgi:hypothetical protein